ncbi:MAG: GNAT family N-acetyltransferase [Verrucomicrobia bacterium]|nr:GNAT family N-acetyltransferase [Verrucomicrobiota bacterium]
MKPSIARCEKLGFPWASRTFLKEDLAHVGYLNYPMILDGKNYHVGALHAVCTKSSHRGQGLASTLIQEVLNWAKDQADFVVLFTEIPLFYERLSFRVIQEHRFALPLSYPKGSMALKELTVPEDNALFHRFFENRSPISNVLSVKDDGTIASFNTLFSTYPKFWSLHYSPALDAILSFEIKDKTLHLYDVIAKKLPPLEQILKHLPEPIHQIYFYFSPDFFTDAAVPEPFVFDKGHFMVHGDWPLTKPFMIPPLSRC